MTVTAKEEREIVAECKESVNVGADEIGAEIAEVESAADSGGETSPQTNEVFSIKDVVAQCLDEKLSLIVDALKSANESAVQAVTDIKKVLDIYNLMTECRNKATLLLTKHIEMYERLRLLADFCRENIEENELQTPFLKSLLTRTSNIERVASRTLGSFGVLPIWPKRNESFDESLHQIISEVDVIQPGDINGAVAECLKMGTVRDGVVAKAAEVVVFKNQAEPHTEAVG